MAYKYRAYVIRAILTRDKKTTAKIDTSDNDFKLNKLVKVTEAWQTILYLNYYIN